MTACGRTDDEAFARGTLAGMCVEAGAQRAPSLDHWRPIASLGAAFGSVEGDLGILLRTPAGENERLLIVEREATGPGNERSLIKWYHAETLGCRIDLKRGHITIACSVPSIVVVQYFARAPKWGVADFRKTAAFCTVLADTLNSMSSGRRTRFRVLVEHDARGVRDWESCGREFGAVLLDDLRQ